MEVDRHLFVIFGGSGDLAQRKLIPALYRLLVADGFTEHCVVLGLGTSELSDEEYQARARRALFEAGVPEEAAARWCASNMHYQQVGRSPDTYQPLAERVAKLEAEHDLPGNRVFYLALPPAAFPTSIEGIGAAGLAASNGWTRLVVEKPFGHDLASAEQLNQLVHRYFDESQVYRIDHYLGKETVRNLMVFRFANTLFERAWNRDQIESVEITVAESLGVEGRARYYDDSGALRDMVQNHLTQILTLVAMEPPVKMEADAIHNEKVKVLRSISPIEPEDAVFGRYTAGEVQGREVRGYLDEPGVPEDSSTPTFVALRLTIDSWRWQGVPFYLRTGKRLPRRVTQVVVKFRRPPVCLFEEDGYCQVGQNVLYMTLQPDEGFELIFDVKTPDEPLRLASLPLSFRYADAFGPLPEAYQTLIRDIVEGDRTLFVRGDEVEESWRVYDGLLASAAVADYRAGSWGPNEADRIPARDGHGWSLGTSRRGPEDLHIGFTQAM